MEMGATGGRLRRMGAEAALALGLATVLGACSAGLVNPEIPPPGSAAFQQGYLDGCASGFTDAGRDGYETNYRKDEARFPAEAEYRDGWLKGHDACYEQERREPKNIGL